MNPPREAFLSHCSADKAAADQLVEVLRRHGVPVWYSATNILGAQQWHDEIGRALQRCDWFLLLLSPRALKSFWMKRELYYALEQSRYVGRLTPLLLEPCGYEHLSWTLSALQMVKFHGDFHGGCRELLRAWRVGYSKS